MLNNAFGDYITYLEAMGIYPNGFHTEMNAIEKCTQLNLDRSYQKQGIAQVSLVILTDTKQSRQRKQTCIMLGTSTPCLSGNKEANLLASK